MATVGRIPGPGEPWEHEITLNDHAVVMERIRAARDLVLAGMETRCDFSPDSLVGEAAAFLRRQFNLDKPPGLPEVAFDSNKPTVTITPVPEPYFRP